MTKRITTLTEAQRATLAPYAAEWITRGQRTGQLTEPEWQDVENAIRRCYGYAGLSEPKVIVRVPSPIVGALAAPIAALLIEMRKRGAVGGAVDDAVGDAVDDAVDDAVRDAVRDAVDGAVGGAVDGAVGGAVVGAVGDAVGGAVGDAVDDAVGDAVRGAVGDAVRGAVGDAVVGAVGGAVRGAVGDAVVGAVGGAVGGAVVGAVGDAVGGAVGDAVVGAVGDAVDDAVGDAVRDAVRDATIRKAIAQVLGDGWYHRFGGQHWSGWMAWRLWFRDHAGLDLDGDLWGRAQAYADANVAGYWWAWGDFVMVSDRPTVLHVEQVAPTGWNSHRLHCEDGPAVAWADGTAVHSWHGTRVPADLVEDEGWTVEQIHAETNTEIRRCAIERIGWGRYAALAGLTMVSEETDPGHPDPTAVLRLYDIPDAERLIGGDVRVLVMVNGSPDRSGATRIYGETVPVSVGSAVEAAAWQYGCPVDMYRQLQRRT